MSLCLSEMDACSLLQHMFQNFMLQYLEGARFFADGFLIVSHKIIFLTNFSLEPIASNELFKSYNTSILLLQLKL